MKARHLGLYAGISVFLFSIETGCVDGAENAPQNDDIARVAPALTAPRAAATSPRTVTLITGDRVVVGSGNGTQAASIQPAIGRDGRQPWQVYGRPFDLADKRPRVAIVVTNMGLSAASTEQAINALPGPVTLAFAPFADGPVTVRGIAQTHYEESDRPVAAAAELRRMGLRVDSDWDWVRIYPGTPQPCEVQTYDDHRMAMSFAITGLRAPGIRIADPGCVSKTFPEFFDVLRGLTTNP